MDQEKLVETQEFSPFSEEEIGEAAKNIEGNIKYCGGHIVNIYQTDLLDIGVGRRGFVVGQYKDRDCVTKNWICTIQRNGDRSSIISSDSIENFLKTRTLGDIIKECQYLNTARNGLVLADKSREEIYILLPDLTSVNVGSFRELLY